MRERDVEAAHRKSVKATGGLSRKFVSPGVRGVPDRIDLYGVDAMVRLALDHGVDIGPSIASQLLAAAITFTETKAPGKSPRPEQLREHARLRALGFTVNVVDSKPQLKDAT